MTTSALTTPSPTSLVLRRTFDAPCGRVFDAWLSPDVMRIFLVGNAEKLLDVTADPRVGGAYRITWQTENGPMTVGGIYREIVKNERIVCTWTWEEDDDTEVHESVLTLEFHPHGDKTELVLTHTNLRSEESRNGHAEGWQAILDLLAQTVRSNVVTRDEWLAARQELLVAEKELTRRSDAVARMRQDMPWVRIDKQYRFDTDAGSASLADLFAGRSQLLVYHFMFGPDYAAGCPSCSAIADGFNGIAPHLANHDVMFTAISRAPLAKLQDYKQRMGWTFPWASSFGSDFNADFAVGFTEEQQRAGAIDYNYRREPAWKDPAPGEGGWGSEFAAMTGVDLATYIRERPGLTAFVLDNGVVYHTYSAYSRGLDGLWNMYQWLDRAPRGRNEQDEVWFRRHDEYPSV